MREQELIPRTTEGTQYGEAQPPYLLHLRPGIKFMFGSPDNGLWRLVRLLTQVRFLPKSTEEEGAESRPRVRGKGREGQSHRSGTS